MILEVENNLTTIVLDQNEVNTGHEQIMFVDKSSKWRINWG